MREQTPYTDTTLLQLIADGNEKAFTEFFIRTSQQVLLWARSVLHDQEAEKEILQEVFISVWLNREQLSTIEFVQAWLKKITLNKSFTWMQAHARRMSKESHQFISATADEIVDQLSYGELMQEVEKIVSALPPQRQQIYRMSREQSMSPGEIARELGLSPGTVRNATSMALATIRQQLKATGRYIPLFLLFLK